MMIYETLNMIRLLTIMLGTYWLTTSQALSATSECLSSQLKSLEESSSSMSNSKSESDNAAEAAAAAAFN